MCYSSPAQQTTADKSPLEPSWPTSAEVEGGEAPLTALLAHAVLTRPELPEGAPAEVVALWRWHAMKEIGHKAVAFDVFMTVTVGWPRRRRYAFRTRAFVEATWVLMSVVARDLTDLLSQAQMRKATFGANLLDRIERPGLETGRIELEIAETALFDSRASTLDVSGELRAAGLHIALDDFGTGYSSLRHLHSVLVERGKSGSGQDRLRNVANRPTSRI
jgi:predicted signal transduction protein with EAL and GGDEF domain